MSTKGDVYHTWEKRNLQIALQSLFGKHSVIQEELTKEQTISRAEKQEDL